MAKKVNIKELARRYTTALFDLAKSENSLDAVGADLKTAENLVNSDAALKKLLASPLLSEAKQIEIVRELGKLGKFNKLTTNLLMVVAKNGRLGNLKEIADAFREQVAENKNEVTATVTSASELGAEQLKLISKELSAKTGKSVVVKQNVDVSIIGGLVVKIGPKMYDFSVKSRLNRLKNKLRAAS